MGLFRAFEKRSVVAKGVFKCLNVGVPTICKSGINLLSLGNHLLIHESMSCRVGYGVEVAIMFHHSAFTSYFTRVAENVDFAPSLSPDLTALARSNSSVPTYWTLKQANMLIRSGVASEGCQSAAI